MENDQKLDFLFFKLVYPVFYVDEKFRLPFEKNTKIRKHITITIFETMVNTFFTFLISERLVFLLYFSKRNRKGIKDIEKLTNGNHDVVISGGCRYRRDRYFEKKRRMTLENEKQKTKILNSKDPDYRISFYSCALVWPLVKHSIVKLWHFQEFISKSTYYGTISRLCRTCMYFMYAEKKSGITIVVRLVFELKGYEDI